MRYLIETYGCQMNKAESSALELIFRERGWEPAKPSGDGLAREARSASLDPDVDLV